MSKRKYQSYLITFKEKDQIKTLCVSVPGDQPLETYHYTSVLAVTPTQVRQYLDSLPYPNPNARSVERKDGNEKV